MAIKGLTDQPAALPQIGILRKGSPRPESGKAPGRDLTHFRFDSKDDRASADFLSAYGDEPREINCVLPFATAEENFLTSKESYGASGLRSRCDGETVSAMRLPDGQIQRQFPSPVACFGLKGDEQGRSFCEDCKNVGRLQIIIPELKRFAYVVAETHSVWDIVHLDQQLKAFQLTFGSLNSIPFVLSRVPEKVSTPRKDGGRVRAEKWLLNIGINPDWAARQLEAVKNQQLASASVYQIGGAIEVLPAAVPAKVRSLPPVQRSNYRQESDWMNFEKTLGDARRSNDAWLADEAIESLTQSIADGRLTQLASEPAIREWEMAKEAIGDALPAIAAQPVQVLTAGTGQKRLKALLSVLGIRTSTLAAEAIAKLYPGKKADDLIEPELRNVRDRILINYGRSQFGESVSDAALTQWFLAVDGGRSDELVAQQWLQVISEKLKEGAIAQ